LNRYQSETKQNVLVGSQSSTYVEFKLKRKDSSNDDIAHKGSFSTFVNTTSTNIQTMYRQAKDFILHRTLFLIIAGICGLYSLNNIRIIEFFFIYLALILAVIFAMVVIYLRCCQESTSRPHTGFQRYEPLVQDENDSPIMGRINGRKIQAIASDSDDENDQTLFSSKMKKSLIP